MGIYSYSYSSRTGKVFVNQLSDVMKIIITQITVNFKLKVTQTLE